jgi:iron complex outermembrane receptor protein
MAALMAEDGVDIDALGKEAETLRQSGASVMHLAADGRLLGLLAVADPIKASTQEALTILRQAGLRIVMATGDGLTTARAVGASLGIDEVHGEVKPADKLALVERLQREGRIVAMAGDGINDAPALAKADVGIAMGTGTDVAMNSAQLTLVKGDLRGIARARLLSVATVGNMRQNLAFAFLYNALGVPVAAGILYPFFGLVLSPVIAAAAMSLSSVSVVGNALRLRTGRAETRFGGPDHQRSGSAVLEGGNGVLAVHADVFKRTSDDLEIPDFARSSRLRAQSPQAGEPRGRLRNSSASADGGALGASLTFDRGYAGLAYSGYNSEYGTVAEEDVRIDMKSKRWDFSGEMRDLGPVITRVKVRLGYTDYEHQELEAGSVATTFLNKGREGTLEAAHGKFGPLTGVFGVQFHSVDFSALGEEAFLPRTRTDTKAAYLYEELPFDKLKLTLGGRIERADVESSGGGPDDPNNPGAPRFGNPQTRSFTPRSLAAGSLYSFSKEVALAVNLSHSERAPTYNELFANGPHTATGQFEVGSSTLSEEKSNGADVQLRWRSGQHSASVGGFYTRFSNYVSVFNSGNTRATDGTLNPLDADEDGVADTSGLSILPEALMRAVPAQFYGLEAEGKFRIYDRTGSLDLTLRGDYVRASNRETGEPLPRMAPLRLGLGLDYRLGNFGSRLDVTHATRQNRVASAELPTDSYTLVNAWLTYRIKAETFNLEAFLKANNLFNQEARVHTSVLKDIAPLPGRGVMLGLRGSF